MQMKATLYIRYSIAAALALLLSACVEEQIEKGAPEMENCMGVYFVEEQENIKTHTLEKGVDETYLDFTVRRANADEEAVIPYEYSVYRLVRNKEEGDTAYVELPLYDMDKFKFDKNITFAKGQRETTVRVSFEGITTGETFTCTMSINDPQYVPVYGANSSSVTFSVQMFEWVKVNGKAVYRDALFSDMFTWEGKYLENTEVEVYRRKDKEHYYRLTGVYTPAYLARLIEGDEAYEANKKGLENTYSPYLDTDASIYVDATDSEKVYFPVQKTGFSDPALGDIYIASDVPEVFGSASNLLYGKFKDGVITFPKNGVLFGMSGTFYFSNTSGKFRIVLPGGNAEDHAIELKAGEVNADGEIPVTFTTSKDVKKVKYDIFKGKISDVAMEGSLEKVGTSGKEFIPSDRKTEMNITPGEGAETGIYTLVACTYGNNGSGYKEYSTAELGYVKPGDDRKVQIFYGIHTDDHYASDNELQNYSSENSFQYWVRGKDITHAQISYYPTSYYKTYEEDIKEQMMSYGSVNNATLKVLNRDGLSGIVGNQLKAGTSYTFVIYAGNGYHSQFFTDTLSTKGTVDYTQRSYYAYDVENFTQPSADSYAGEWIPVSVDVFDSEAEGRSIRGNWRAKEVVMTVDGDKVTASGLFPSLKTNPAVKFELKDGLLYSTENRGANVTVKDSTNIIPTLRFEYTYIPKTGALSSTGYFYDKFDMDGLKDRRDMFMGGFVHEDVIAFVDNTTEFKFWAFVMGGYQKNRMGEENLSDVIGDAHGELILVRKGSELLKSLKEKTSESKDADQTLNSLTEAHRVAMPQINSIIRDVEKFDIAHELLQFRSDVKVRSNMEY